MKELNLTETIAPTELFELTRHDLESCVRKIVPANRNQNEVVQEALIHLWRKCEKAITLSSQNKILKTVLPHIKGYAKDVQESHRVVRLPQPIIQLIAKIKHWMIANDCDYPEYCITELLEHTKCSENQIKEAIPYAKAQENQYIPIEYYTEDDLNNEAKESL